MALMETSRDGFEEGSYPDALGYTVEPWRDKSYLHEYGIMPLGRLAATPHGGDGVVLVLSSAFGVAPSGRGMNY